MPINSRRFCINFDEASLKRLVLAPVWIYLSENKTYQDALYQRSPNKYLKRRVLWKNCRISNQYLHNLGSNIASWTIINFSERLLFSLRMSTRSLRVLNSKICGSSRRKILLIRSYDIHPVEGQIGWLDIYFQDAIGFSFKRL